MIDEKQVIPLMTAYQAGDPRAFEDFYRLTRPSLYGYLVTRTLDLPHAEELLQETYLQIHRSRRTYLPGRPVGPWIFAIARHVHQMDRRARCRRDARERAPEDDMPEIPVAPAIVAEHEMAGVRKALARLPADQREVLLLHHCWGYSFREIAHTLGIRGTTAKVRAHRGLAKLRELLGRSPVTAAGGPAKSTG